MNKIQPLSAKLGEVKFRKKLVQQHLGKNNLIPEEPTQKEILEILKKRIYATKNIIIQLKSKGFIHSPFLEIGAEKGQRSLALVNEFGLSGFASDISLDSLSSSIKLAKLLNYEKLPDLVCCDAYKLPFADESFPFIFCFETLHHFPDPAPIISEIHRVLTPGGVFYFGEEPVKQIFNLNLWRRGYHLNPTEKFLKFIGVLPFLSRIGKSEVNQGILEEEFSLQTWKGALSIFDKANLKVSPVFFGLSSSLLKKFNKWVNPKTITSFLIALQGGGIEGFAIKKGKRKLSKSIYGMLTCPDCKNRLSKTEKNFVCPSCKRLFIKKNGVLMLLPVNLQKIIYD